MRTRILLPALVFVSAVVLSGYVYLSVCAGRALEGAEFVKFSNTILWAAALHGDENGGSRALNLAKEALSSALATDTIAVAEKSYHFPLPKYSIRREDHGQTKHFLTFASFDELQNYFHDELPKAGWKHTDQLGAAHTFDGYDTHMVITHHFHLTTGISDVNIIIAER